MNLLRIAIGRWEVLAHVDPEGRCPVLDLLAQPGAGSPETQMFLSPTRSLHISEEEPTTQADWRNAR